MTPPPERLGRFRRRIGVELIKSGSGNTSKPSLLAQVSPTVTKRGGLGRDVQKVSYTSTLRFI